MEDKKLPDTPWHVGYVKMDELDSRRHKAWCIHYSHGKCYEEKMVCYRRRCYGSSHCKYYAVSYRMAQEVYLNTRTIEEEKADNLNNALFSGKASVSRDKIVGKNSPQKQEEGQQGCIRFTGIASIRLKEIVIDDDYNNWKPSRDELNAILVFYDEHKKMDKPIIVDIVDDQYVLKGNYLQYYASKRLNKTWIKAIMKFQKKKKKK